MSQNSVASKKLFAKSYDPVNGPGRLVRFTWFTYPVGSSSRHELAITVQALPLDEGLFVSFKRAVLCLTDLVFRVVHLL